MRSRYIVALEFLVMFSVVIGGSILSGCEYANTRRTEHGIATEYGVMTDDGHMWDYSSRYNDGTRVRVLFDTQETEDVTDDIVLAVEKEG